MKMTVFWDDVPCSLIALMMEAISTSEISINLNDTIQHNIPEDSYLHVVTGYTLKVSIIWIDLEEFSPVTFLIILNIFISGGLTIKQIGQVWVAF
jgi:hypothetical protein